MTDNTHLTNPNGGYEKSDINIAKVIIYGVFGIIFLVAVLIFTWDYFAAVKEKTVREMVLQPTSVPLRELRARENGELTSYKLLDASKGVYRIPIERAMELMADEAYRARSQKSGKN
ncbi:MAG: hypothetical protein ACOYVF_13845 [Candidatus Zixiibacteriota bacterium]